MRIMINALSACDTALWIAKIRASNKRRLALIKKAASV